jgi:tetratricopeptide (TPR) repeat protein
MKTSSRLSRGAAACAVVGAAAFVLASPAAAFPGGDVERAKELIAAGRDDEAVAILENACREAGGDLAPHFYLGYCYGAAGRLEEARAEYELCARYDPDRPEVHYNLGVILNEMGLYQAAARAFEEALLLDPGRVDANFNCGLAHYFAREPVQAIRFYREARALAPEDVSVLYWLALAYEAIDRRVALSIWEDYVDYALNEAAEAPRVKSAREHITALRAGKRP